MKSRIRDMRVIETAVAQLASCPAELHDSGQANDYADHWQEMHHCTWMKTAVMVHNMITDSNTYLNLFIEFGGITMMINRQLLSSE